MRTPRRSTESSWFAGFAGMAGGASGGMRIVVTGASENTGSCLRGVLAADPEIDTVDLVGVLHGATVMVHLAWLFQPARWSVATWQVTGRS